MNSLVILFNIKKINLVTKSRNREVLRTQASLIWCRMNKDLTRRTAVDIYAPDIVGIRFGVALAYEQGEAELKGKSDKGIKFAYALNGFRLILSTFPAKRYFSFEQVSGHGEILKPGTPLYLVDGSKLYTVSGVSSTITRFFLCRGLGKRDSHFTRHSCQHLGTAQFSSSGGRIQFRKLAPVVVPGKFAVS